MRTATKAIQVALRDHRLVDAVTGVLIRPLLHRYCHPTLGQLSEDGRMPFLTDWTIGAAHLAGVDGDAVAECSAEFERASEELNGRPRSERGYPANFDSGSELTRLLFSFVRTTRPSTIIETGVANGISTFFILTALRLNGMGTLHSVDVRNDVALQLNANEMDHWEFHKLPLVNARLELVRLLAELPPGDCFIHDSNHSFSWQSFEYATAWNWLSARGVLISDDVDASYAFSDFCAKRSISPIYLQDSYKVIGAVSRNK